jgi:hypothetical protein
LTHRPNPIGTVEVSKLIESADGAPSVTDSAHVMSIEASTGSVKEPESEKAAEQPKVLSPLAVTGLSKPSSTATATPRKRRMTSILDDVLEYMKVPDPASAKAYSENLEMQKKQLLQARLMFLPKFDLRKPRHRAGGRKCS